MIPIGCIQYLENSTLKKWTNKQKYPQMKKTEYIRKSGKYYPDKPYDPYNRYPYASIKDVRDCYGSFVTSTEGYSYFIVWIDFMPGNRPKVELFVDKEEVNIYKSDYDCHPSQWSKDWLHYCEGTKILAINGRSAEELNNYIAKILMDFYNKRILEYIEKNKPKKSSSHNTSNITTESPQVESLSPTAKISSKVQEGSNINIHKRLTIEEKVIQCGDNIPRQSPTARNLTNLTKSIKIFV